MMRTNLIFLALLLYGLTACNSSEPKRMNLAGEAQGTYYAITYFDEYERNLQLQVDSLLRAFDLSVSLWEENSILSRVNSGDSSTVLDNVFIYNFLLSKEIAILTDGYFDFTIGPLAKAWGFHRKNRMEMSAEQVDSLRKLVDYTKVKLTEGKIVKDDPRMSFDFNAVAQGHSVDLIAQLFDSIGITHFIIDVGGEIVARNTKPDSSKWRVAIESPAQDKNDERNIEVIVAIENKALATSGSYRKYFEIDGKRYSHAINPKTGYPVDHQLLSVTVLADNAALADALSTAFMVMGIEKSQKLLEKLPDIEAYFIFWNDEKTYGTYATDGFKAFLTD